MSFLSQASPQKSFNAPSTVAARIELVPSPDPAGMAESSVTSNPEPNSLSWASSEEYDREQNRGRNPASATAAFGMENGEPTVENCCSSSQVRTRSALPRSIERKTMWNSLHGLI